MFLAVDQLRWMGGNQVSGYADAAKMRVPQKKRDTFLKLISAGNYQQTACRVAGISEWTFWDWTKKGKRAREDKENGIALTAAQEEYYEWVEALDEARAVAEAALVARWYTEAVDGDWRAAERFLAKAFPERWSDPATRLEITGAGGGPVAQLSAHMHVIQEADGDRQRKVLEALVESGDLPPETLEAWDGKNGDSAGVIDADVVEEAVQPDNPTHPASEAAGVPDVVDD
jgi:hypothetical protein